MLLLLPFAIIRPILGGLNIFLVVGASFIMSAVSSSYVLPLNYIPTRDITVQPLLSLFKQGP